MTVARLKVLIADQNPAIRRTLGDLLGERYDIVAEVEDGTSVCSKVAELTPNIILLGVSFAGVTGFQIARHLRQSDGAAKIIVISLHESTDLVRAAFAVGASGYVFISRLLDDLPAAIDAVSRGQVFQPQHS